MLNELKRQWNGFRFSSGLRRLLPVPVIRWGIKGAVYGGIALGLVIIVFGLPAHATVVIPACGLTPWVHNKVLDLNTLGVDILKFLALGALIYAFYRGIKAGQTVVALLSAGAVCALALWLGPGGGMNWGATQVVGETGSKQTSALIQPAASTTPAASTDNSGAC